MQAAAPPALAARGITKRFGTALVLDRVDFDLRAGEIHALLGENGAGKSTLMNVLTGLYAAEAGRIELDGRPVAIHSPAAALAAGIGMVHQHFRLVPVFTGAENVALAAGALPALAGRGAIAAALAQAVERTGLDVPLDRPVATLSVADRQRIEILKALTLGARVLILDEPTAVLTDDEAAGLLAMIGRLAASGTAIVLISHKLREVMAAGHRASVMRQGRMALSGLPVAEATPDLLSRAMMGEAPAAAAPRALRAAGAPLLRLEGVTVAGPGGAPAVQAGLTLPAGRIVGIAGVGGNGQQDLAEAILGLRPLAAGRILLDGRDLAGATVAARRDAGLRYVPSDRSAQALAPNLPLTDNLAAAAVRAGRLGRRWLPPRRLTAHARGLIEAFAIAGAGTGAGLGTRPIRLLSGGNAQKAVLARELDPAARVIVAHSPTRGLDLAACAYVHDRLAEAAARGAAVLLISEDLEEILALSDEIHVMSRGRLATAEDGRPSRARIGALMLGHA